MEKKKIQDEAVINAIVHSISDERDENDGFYSTFAEIDGMVFVVWGNSHLRVRGGQRGGLSNTSFWIDSFISLMTETEDVCDEVLSLKSGEEAALTDEEKGKIYFIKLTSVDAGNGVIVNKIYVKTLLDASDDEKRVKRDTDVVIAYNRCDGTVSDNSKLLK